MRTSSSCMHPSPLWRSNRPALFSSSWRSQSTRSRPLGRWMTSSSPAPACSRRVWSSGKCWQATRLLLWLRKGGIFVEHAPRSALLDHRGKSARVPASVYSAYDCSVCYDRCEACPAILRCLSWESYLQPPEVVRKILLFSHHHNLLLEHRPAQCDVKRCCPETNGDEPAGYWLAPHDCIHGILVNKKTNPIFMSVLFATEEKLMSILSKLFRQSSSIVQGHSSDIFSSHE